MQQLLSIKEASFREGVDLAKLTKELGEGVNAISSTAYPRRVCCGRESQQDGNCRMTNSISHLLIVWISTELVKL